MKKIYLAGAFFNQKDRETISFLADRLRKQGHTVYVPMEHTVENAWDLTNKEWGKQVFIDDTYAILNSDCMVAVITNGMNDDTGTTWEIGYASGLRIPVYVIHNYDTVKGITSLMVWNSAERNFNMDTIINNPKWNELTEDTIETEQK
jgi:nucleoside deoxyribosyltransferase